MADAKTGLFQKLMKNPQVMKMAEQMFNSMGEQGQANFLNRPNVSPIFDTAIKGDFGSKAANDLLAKGQVGKLVSEIMASGASPANMLGYPTGDPSIPNDLPQINNIGFRDLGSLALGAAKAHPFKTAGLIGLGAGNIGGLTDNSKFGGQLAGLGLGGLGAYKLASGNPYMAAIMTMGGGALGSLFDKLRAQKEQEQAIIGTQDPEPLLPFLKGRVIH